jgi:hypothetical protein
MVAPRSDPYRQGSPNVWERLFNLVQEGGIQLGIAVLDGTSVRAHQNAAGTGPKGALKRKHVACALL